ncbi:MAG TPA: hypothetical protein VN253_26485 [Kofleriaceae bacterium]|nr:hypothetical protein [Kofleriaceae bacterium]
MWRVALALILAACRGGGASDALCQRAVDHVFAMTLIGPPGSEPKGDEAVVIEAAKAGALDRCRREGLSQAQADCILAVHVPDWDDQVRACPAFAAKPPSWMVLRPPRDDRRAMRSLPPIPDGPRESKRHYRQLAAHSRGMCGLTDDGAVLCWGGPTELRFPAGTFVQIAIGGDVACGRDAEGRLRCASPGTLLDRIPADAFTDFALAYWGGCGVRERDQALDCWSYSDGEEVAPPDGQFTSVVLGVRGGCARARSGATACFGAKPPALPREDVLAYSEDEGACHVTARHQLACVGTYRLGPAPAGQFDTVAISRGHACATRTGGGTVCWAENDDGECNVPQ